MHTTLFALQARLHAEARCITMATLGAPMVRDADFFVRLTHGRVTARDNRESA